MKKTAIKVLAAIIALCVLFGAFPISASADNRYEATLTFNSEYGYARMESDTFEDGQTVYLYAFPNDACLVDKITVTNDSDGSTIYTSFDQIITYRDGTVSRRYRFRMPQSTISVDVTFRPVKEEKQVELSSESDLGMLRTDSGTNTAVPTSTVRILACPTFNSAAGTDNIVKSITCFTESGVEINIRKIGVTPDFIIYAFTMPDENVRVSATFDPPAGWRRLQHERAENGTFTVPAEFAQSGSNVTVTAQPDPGYVLNALYYISRSTGARTDLNTTAGQSTYTFVMPDEDISVHAHFGLNDNAHSITPSCDGKLGGQINLNAYVASPGEIVSALVIPYNRHQIKNVVCINKNTGAEMDVTVTGDSYLMQIEFPMPDADVEIIASYIFPSVKLGDPLVYVYEDKTREDRRVQFDEEANAYSVEVYEDTEYIELFVVRDYNLITVSCAATGYSESISHYFSRKVSLSEGVNEMNILCEVDDPNSGEHLSAEYTLLISRTKRYIPVERIVLNDGNPYSLMDYFSGISDTRGWLPSVTYYPENADQKSVTWSSSDESVLKFGRPESWWISYGVNDSHFDPSDPFAKNNMFFKQNKSGVVTITATSPDGVSASMKVVVTNRFFTGTLTYDAGEGVVSAEDDLDYDSIQYWFEEASAYTEYLHSDIVMLNTCRFRPPAGKVFKAWSYNGAEYAPGDWFYMPEENVTLTAVYQDLYTAVWLDVDGKELDSKRYTADEGSPTTEIIPAKAADYYNTYTFDKWDDGTVEGKTITFRPLFITHEKEQSTYLIHVNNLIGEPVTVEVESTDTVAALKQKLSAADGTPVDEQHLIYRDTLLKDEMTLADYDIHKEAVLDMAHRAAIRTVVWLDADGEELAREDYYKDAAEPLCHIVPVKAEERKYTYTFDRWDDGTVDGHVKTYAPLWISHTKSFYYVQVGDGTADVEVAYPGDVVTLTADEAPNNYMYHAGWNVVSKNAEITGNTFIMPAEHVYIYADFQLKKATDLSLDFSSEKAYLGKPLSISGDLSYDDTILDVGGEITITFSSGTPDAEDAVSYQVPVTNGTFTLDIPAMTTTNSYVWFEYPGEGMYSEAIVSTTIRVYEVSAASLEVALYEEEIKRTYDLSDELDTTDLYIWLYWTDGTVEKLPVTPEMVSGFSSAAPGELTLTVACPYPIPAEDELTYTVTINGSAFLLGDADGDGVVTILDATAIQRRLVNLPTASFDENAADADEDTEVTILDATAIQRHLAGLSTHEGIGTLKTA